MATYVAAGSNGEMEGWYALGAFAESRIWAQMMRQISRRGEDVGVTCNWRNGLVNPGAAVQYPEDDFLVGLAADPLAVGKEYMEQIFGTLEEVCEASHEVDCKIWFFAPNEGSLPYCSGLDGTVPMGFTLPTLVADRREWKEWMTKMREVIDALDRLKTVWPIPHPGTLYTLEYDSDVTYSKMGYQIGAHPISGATTIAKPSGATGAEIDYYDDGPGYRLDPGEEEPFLGWDGLDGTDVTGFLTGLFVDPVYRYPEYGPAFGTVSDTADGVKMAAWAGVGKATNSLTGVKFSDADWAEFVATYGEVVNSIAWEFTFSPGAIPYADGVWLGVSVVAAGDTSFTITANAAASLSGSVELDLGTVVANVFNSDGTLNAGRRDEFDSGGGNFEDTDYGILEHANWVPVWDIDPAVDEVTACDV